MAPRTLFVSTYAPVVHNGRDLRTYTVVRALAALGPVDLVYVPHGGHGPARQFLEIEGLELHEVVPSRGAGRVVTYATKLAQGVPELIARSCSAEVVAATAALAATPDRGRVVAGDINAMVSLMGFARSHPVIYNAHNIESSYVARTLRERVRIRELALLERRVLRRAAESWMVSRRDLAQAQALAPGAVLRYVPNVADVASIDPQPAGAGGDTVLLVGDFTYGPNVSGLRWLVDAVLPQVWAQRPDARLRVCGRGLDAASLADPRIDVRGFVDELADAYRGAAAVAVPLTEGAGTPLKFVEALAFGVPAVATPLAARGLDVVSGEHFRLGADAAAFAAQLVDLLAGGDVEMARRARALAEREYSVQALARLLDGPPAPATATAQLAPSP